MSDDLTIAYMLGVEDMRSRLHKQADEIERLRAENEKLREALRPYADKYHWDIKHYDEVMSYGSLKAHDFYAAAKALGESGDE